MKASQIVPFVFLGYSWTVISEDIYIITDGGYNGITYDYNYTIVLDLDPQTETCGQLTLNVLIDEIKVGTEKVAFIALFSGDSDAQPLYEIVFGLNANTENYIRDAKLGKNKIGNDTFFGDTFSGNSDKLIIIWNNGTITAGSPTFSQNMTYTYKNPFPIKHIAVSTSSGKGHWNFTTPVLIPQGCVIPVEPVVPEETCQCPCSSVGVNKWAFLAHSNLTKDEIKIIMEPELQQIRNRLAVDKTNISAYVRTKTSATDNRVSSKSMGILGIIILTSVIFIFVVSDCLNVFKQATCFPWK